MTLIIRQLVIRGEILDDSGKASREESLTLDKVKELIETAKREIEKDCREKIYDMIENTSAR